MIHAAAMALALAVGEWTTGDTIAQSVVAAAIVADCSTTLDMSSGRLQETNPILGKHPTKSDVYGWCAGAIVGTTAVSILLPPEWRRAWQGVILGIEIGMIQNNLRIGLRMRW